MTSVVRLGKYHLLCFLAWQSSVRALTPSLISPSSGIIWEALPAYRYVLFVLSQVSCQH